MRNRGLYHACFRSNYTAELTLSFFGQTLSGTGVGSYFDDPSLNANFDFTLTLPTPSGAFHLTGTLRNGVITATAFDIDMDGVGDTHIFSGEPYGDAPRTLTMTKTG